MTQVNTKAVTDRREIRLGTFDDLLAEVGRIEQADAQGALRALGNWSPGQNLQHIARFMACTLDGFPDDPPLFFKLIGRVLRLFMGRKLFEKTVPAGFQLPKDAPFLPADTVGLGEAASELRAQIERVRGGASFIPASPFFGKLSREQWIELHLRHSELHLSFIGIEGDAPVAVDAGGG